MPGKIELLAPAGKWDVLKKVAEAGADAVYIGGKRFNMRLLKSDFNFSDEQIKTAVDFLHAQNKKLYITLNNLYFTRETDEIKEYLLFLEELKVDALIVQDLSLVKLHKTLNLTLPLHASVQMGIGNIEAVNFLEKLGFSRVILSKNLSLAEIKEIKQNVNIGLEFFAHGDMCISHTGQCHMSSFIAGASGNRGRCIKPCRWPYKLNGQEGYYLAHNDLSLLPFVKDLVNTGINSLKIEGRMRDATYLSEIVNIYRSAIDSYYAEKENYRVQKDHLNRIEKIKARNISVANLWGELDIDAVDITGKREPFFPTKPRKLEKLESEILTSEVTDLKCKELAVKIGDISTYEIVKDYCDTIILGLGEFKQDKSGFNITEINSVLKEFNSSAVNIKIETPRIVSQKNWVNIMRLAGEIAEINNKLDSFAGFIVNDLGSLFYLHKAGFKVWGGPGLNITNSKASNILLGQGAEGLCLSPELKLNNLREINLYTVKLEIMVHGPLCGMITDYPIEKFYANKTEINYLKDNFGQKYRLRLDNEGRTHIFHPYDLSLYDYLTEFLRLGFTRMRIDGHFYDNEQLASLLKIYQQKLRENKNMRDNLLNLFPQGLTDLSFDRPNV